MTRSVGGSRESQVEANVRVVTRMLMAARGVKPAELALRLGVSKTAIFNRLGGQKPFTLTEVGVLSEFFDVPPGVLLAGPSALINAAAKTAGGTPMGPKVTPRHGVSTSKGHPNGRHLSIAA